MGNCWANVFRRRRLRRHIVLILIGLDNAGKTKTVNNLVGEKDNKVLPTVGFKAVNLVHKDTPVTIYDLGGSPGFRAIWAQYYSEVHGVIFVIDSSDFSRLDECKTVLEEVLSHDKISGKPVLVLANKQDKTGALDDIDVVEKLNIEPLVNRYRCPTLVESYTAVPDTTSKFSKKPKIDPGLRKGYLWLLNYVVKRYGDINLRVQTDIHAELERRQRMMIKPSNRASQTFIALSDDTTQTGFENPNFDGNAHLEAKGSQKDGIIIVKPIRNPNSINTSMALESESSNTDNTSNARPKLSPLFGRSNTSIVTEPRIELESRSEFRKLSPLVRNKSGINQHIDFKCRPQSSSSPYKKSDLESKSSSFQADHDKSYNMYTNGDGNLTWDSEDNSKHRTLPNDIELSEMDKQIALTSRDYAAKQASSEVAISTAAPPLSARPASASSLVRRQLQLSVHHRRRLSLRSVHRNKTSPERTSMLIYDTSKARHLDRGKGKGDYEHPANFNKTEAT